MKKTELLRIIREETKKAFNEAVDLSPEFVQKIKAGEPLTVADYVAKQNKSWHVNKEEQDLVRAGVLSVYSTVYNLLKTATNSKDKHSRVRGIQVAKAFIVRLYQRDPKIKEKGYNPGLGVLGSGAFPRINRHIKDLASAAIKGYIIDGTGPSAKKIGPINTDQ